MHTASLRSSSLNRGYAMAALSAVILSTTAIFIRHLTVVYQLPSPVLAFWRNIFVVLTLVPALAVLRPDLLRVRAQDLSYLAAHGLVLAVFNLLWTFSVARCGAAIATVLVYTSGASTALLGFLFLRERMNPAKLLAVILCLAGSALVSGAFGGGAWHSDVAGVSTGILAGLFYAVYSVMGRSAAQRGLDPWTAVLYTFGFGAAVLLAFVAAFAPAELLWLGGAASGWGTLFLLAAGPTVVGFGLYNVSLGYLPSSVANLIVTLEPAFTAVIAYALLGERLTGTEIAGGLVILAGVVVLRIGAGPDEPLPGTSNQEAAPCPSRDAFG